MAAKSTSRTYAEGRGLLAGGDRSQANQGRFWVFEAVPWPATSPAASACVTSVRVIFNSPALPDAGSHDPRAAVLKTSPPRNHHRAAATLREALFAQLVRVGDVGTTTLMVSAVSTTALILLVHRGRVNLLLDDRLGIADHGPAVGRTFGRDFARDLVFSPRFMMSSPQFIELFVVGRHRPMVSVIQKP